MEDPEHLETPEVVIGGIYEHCHGIRYRVDMVVTRAEGYEEMGKLTKDVIYTQLTDGEVNPAGTQYSRSVDEFLHGTTEVDGRKVSIFSLCSTD